MFDKKNIIEHKMCVSIFIYNVRVKPFSFLEELSYTYDQKFILVFI
jgi:hypothetical protein